MDRVIDLLGTSPLFENLEPHALRSLAQEVSWTSAQPGERIVGQGQVGDALYLIVEGTARVTVARVPGADSGDSAPAYEVPVARLTPGDHFGEQALLHEFPVPRTATVQAITECQLLEIPAAAFRRIIEFDDELRRLLEDKGREYLLNHIVETTRALQSAEHRLAALGDTRRAYSDRQVLFRQGQPADGALLLTSGTVRVKFYDRLHRVESMVELVAPRLLGERGILHQAPRSGTAVAVGDVETIVIPAEQLRALHQRSPALRTLCQVIENFYDVPGVGRVVHYHGTFLKRPAYCVLIASDGGREFISYKVIDSEIFSLTATQLTTPQTLRYEADERVREILVDDGRLVGLTCYGRWPDSREMTEAVLAGVELADDDLAAFAREGRLPGVLERAADSQTELMCRCMQVSTQTIAGLIASGVSRLPEIMNRCGAGTICGGCRPHIKQMLGYQAWVTQQLLPPVRHTEGIWSFRFAPLHGSIEAFSPGQHIVVRAQIDGGWIARSYTLTSTPEDPYYEITVKREPGGLFSNWLFDNAETQPVFQASAPQGDFIVEWAAGSPILFFGGGIGITPAIGLLRSLAASCATQPRPEVPIVVDYSARTTEDFITQDLFERVAEELPNVHYRRRVTSIDGRIGEQSLSRLLQQYEDPRVYICGPKAFETSLVAMLEAHGVAPDAIQTEEFASVAPGR